MFDTVGLQLDLPFHCGLAVLPPNEALPVVLQNRQLQGRSKGVQEACSAVLFAKLMFEHQKFEHQKLKVGVLKARP
jgi:hypothetical protein